MARRVAITGLGLVTPLGTDLQSTWDGLLAGRSGAGPITRFDPVQSPVKFACEVKGFEPTRFLDKKEVRRYDLFAQFAVGAAEQAVTDACLASNWDSVDLKRVGAIVGTGTGGLQTFEENARALFEKGPSRVSPFFVPMYMPNVAAALISMRYGAKGPNYCTVSACASSAHSVGDALELIRNDKADIMIAGGAEAAITPLAVASFANMKALSERNDDPPTASRPFDKDRDGFVMGDGAGVLVLEEWEHARRRGAKIYAEVVGYGMTADAHHITAPAPDGSGAQEAMRLAMQNGGVRLQEVGYINAHGTSTPHGDAAETAAVKTVFGEQARKVVFGSTKSMTGHRLGGAEHHLAGLLAEHGLHGGCLGGVAVRGGRAVRIDVADLLQAHAAVLHRQPHGFLRPGAVGGGSGDMMRVGGHAVAHHFGVDLCAAPPGVLPLLEHQHPGTVAHHESVAVLVERATRGRGIVVTLGQRFHVGEARHHERRDRRLGAAGDHDVGLVVPDDLEGVGHAVGGLRAGRHRAVVRPLRAVAHGNQRRGHVRHVHGDEERGDAARALLEQGAAVFFEGLEPAGARADQDAHPLQVHRVPARGETGIGHRLLRGADRELREQVVAADFFLVEEPRRVEGLHFARELHGALRRVEARDRPRPGAAGQQAVPGALDIGAQRRQEPEARDRDPARHPAISPSFGAGTAAPAPRCAASRLPRRGCRCRIPSRTPSPAPRCRGCPRPGLP